MKKIILALLLCFGTCKAATVAQWLRDGMPVSSVGAITPTSGAIGVGNGTGFTYSTTNTPIVNGITVNNNSNVTFTSTAQPFKMFTQQNTFSGTVDDVCIYGYNIQYPTTRVNTGQPALYFTLEAEYNNGVSHLMEFNFDYTNAGGTSKRMLGFAVNRTTDAAEWNITNSNFAIGTSADRPFVVLSTTGANTRLDSTTNSTSIFGTNGTIDLRNLNNTNGNWTSVFGYDSTGTVSSGIHFFNTDHTNHYGEIGLATRSSANLSERVRINNTGAVTRNDAQFAFSSTTDPAAAADVGIARDAASILRVTNGSTGTSWAKASGLIVNDGANTGMNLNYSQNGIQAGSNWALYWTNGTASGGTPDSGISRTAAGVLKATDGASGSGWFQNSAGRAMKAANQTVTDSTTLANDSHLTFTLKGSRKYSFQGTLFCTSVATSGIKFDFGNSTATVTNLRVSAAFFTASALAESQTTSLTTTLGSTALVTRVDISGNFEVNAAGTFGLRFAQNAETGAAESIVLLRGSYINIEDMP